MKTIIYNTQSKHIFFAIIIFAFLSQSTQAQILINEFMASNESTLLDNYDEYDDWVELYNNTDEDIDIGGWYITDDLNDPLKHPILNTYPYLTTVPAQGFLILWLDNDTEQGIQHANFKLSASGEAIGLTQIIDDVPIFIDALEFEQQYADVSYGRFPDGDLETGYFLEPTPNASNSGNVINGFLPAPESNMESGCYPEAIEVTLTNPIEDIQDVEIRYTLDSSNPTETSTLYTEPFEVDENTIVRAALFKANFLPSAILTHSYFFDEETNLPIFSVVADPSDLFGEETGIYVEDSAALLDRKDWRKPAFVEFFDTNKELVFDLQAELKLFGRTAIYYPQKSLAVYSKTELTSSVIEHPFFRDKPELNEFKSFLLRSSSDDWVWAMLRDALTQRIFIEHCSFGTQAYEPSITFINGEYYGIHNIREKYNEAYLENNYGADPDNLDILKGEAHLLQATEGDTEHYDAMFAYMLENDLSESQHYEYILTQMDIISYVDYVAAQLYCDNLAFMNNRRMWRERTDEGVWRFLLNDTDKGLFSSNGNRFDLFYELDPLFPELIVNEDFKNLLAQRSASLMNIAFRAERTFPIVETATNEIANEMPHHIERWADLGGVPDMDFWNQEVQRIHNFANVRVPNLRNHYLDALELEGLYDLTTHVSIENAGTILAQGILIPPDSTNFTGQYFQDIPLTLQAIANPGYEFVEWVGAYESTNSTITVTLNSVDEITAVFEESVLKEGLHINEFMASNNVSYSDEYGEFDDWIEIYNSTNHDIDLGGLYITDDLENPTLWQIPLVDPDITTIPANGFKILWADKEIEQGLLHVDMKLSTEGESIGLAQFIDGELVYIDSLSFGPQTIDESVGCFPDGGTEIITFNLSTPNSSNISNDGSIFAELDLKVYLQGCYDEDTELMTNLIRQDELLPLVQPYGDNPWEYEGEEEVPDINSFPDDAVDWILVELRTGDPSISGFPTTILDQSFAGILLTNGQIKAPDGSPIEIMVQEDAAYHILIRHRNHLNIISSTKIDGAEYMSYDFTNSNDQALGLFQQLILPNGMASMYAGDMVPDGIIQVSDFGAWKENPAMIDAYSPTDSNLDGIIQVSDSDLWFLNRARNSIAEVKF